MIWQATQYRSFRRQAKSLIDRLSYNFVKQRRFALLTNETTGLHWLNLVLLLFWWLFQFRSIELMMLSNHPILCRPFPFAFSLSQHQGLSQWTVGRIWHWEMSPAGWKVSSMLVGKTRGQLLITPEKWSNWAKAETILSISLNKRRRYFLPRGKRGR